MVIVTFCNFICTYSILKLTLCQVYFTYCREIQQCGVIPCGNDGRDGRLIREIKRAAHCESLFWVSIRRGIPPIWLQGIPARQPAVGFVVHPPLQAFQAREQSQRFDMKDRIFLVCSGQVVVWDLRPEVMNVMEADVPAEPLQQCG